MAEPCSTAELCNSGVSLKAMLQDWVIWDDATQHCFWIEEPLFFNKASAKDGGGSSECQ